MEVEKRTNRASIDSEVFELPSSSFVLEPDDADITKRLRLISQPLRTYYSSSPFDSITFRYQSNESFFIRFIVPWP